MTLRIWSLEDTSLHTILESYCWKLDEHLTEVDALYLQDTKLFVVSSSAKVVSLTKSFSKTKSLPVEFHVIPKLDSKNFSLAFIPLWDPAGNMARAALNNETH